MNVLAWIEPSQRGRVMIEAAMMFWRKNIIIANFVHAIAGFGFALVLQHHLYEQPFLPVAIGGILLAFTLVMHIYAFTK